jgi:hypothetical protein
MVRLEKRKIWYSMRYDFNLVSWHVMNGPE